MREVDDVPQETDTQTTDHLGDHGGALFWEPQLPLRGGLDR